jgi:hypothetical protein
MFLRLRLGLAPVYVAFSLSIPPCRRLTSWIWHCEIASGSFPLYYSGCLRGCVESLSRQLRNSHFYHIIPPHALYSAVQNLPTATPTPTPEPPAPEMTPEIEAMMRKFKNGGFGGNQKIEKIKKRLEKRGYDMSSINTNSLSGFSNLDDKMIENLLISMAKGGFGKEEAGNAPAASAKGAGSGVYDNEAVPASGDDDAEVVDEL